jgi:hypothetical protein
MGKGRQGMPVCPGISGFGKTKSPSDVYRVYTVLDIAIFRDILIVIKIGEFISAYIPVNDYGGGEY